MKNDPYLISPELSLELHGIQFPLEYLYRHTLMVGQPGSGKTRCVLMPLIRAILATTGTNPDQKAALVVVDPKNELTAFLHNLTREVGREADLIVYKPGSAWYNPLANPFFTEAEAIEKIIVFGNQASHSGAGHAVNEAYWANAQRSLLSAVVLACRSFHDEITFPLLNQTFDDVNRLNDASALTEWLKGREIPASALQGFKEFLRLPSETTRPCVSTSVSSILYFWQAEPLRTLITPMDNLPTFDPFDIIDQGKILVIGCASAAFGVSIAPLLLALKEHLFAALLSRDQIDVEEGPNWRPINQQRPVFLIADEFQTYLSPDSTTGELVAMDRLRSAKAGFLAVTQNLASIHSVLRDASHASRLISLFSNQFYLANICPYSTQQASWLMGTKTKRVVQYSQEPQMAPPLPTGHRPSNFRTNPQKSGVVVPQQISRVDAATLAKMPTGEFWLRLANGQVIKGRAKP
jgi:hypothetical protein